MSKVRNKDAEYHVQLAVCEYLSTFYPDVVFLSEGSGVRLTMRQAVKAKPLKSSRGLPDLIILEPFKTNLYEYHGLAIELKADGVQIYKKDGSLRKDEHLEEQAEVLDKLRKKGYYANFCIGASEAIELIDSCFGERT